MSKNTVKYTKELDRFNFIESNRPLDRNHINRLKSSFKVTGDDLLRARPIIINNDNCIIDGQHRLTACRELGLGVWYVNSNIMGINEVCILNQNNKNWTMAQFAHMYAKEGNENYKTFIKFREEHGIGLQETLRLLTGGKSGAVKQFKDGYFDVSGIEDAQRSMRMIHDFKRFYKGYKRRSFIYACLKMFKVEGYSHNNMKQKVRYMHSYIQDAPAVDQYLRQLEHVYNYNVKNPQKRLRFFV